MAFQLKGYQKRCLEKLGQYLRRVVELDTVTSQAAKVAFEELSEGSLSYHEVTVEGVQGLPYVCLRVPTGGGKTFMAAHGVGIATKELLRTDRCLVLWLAPTTQIVEQTLKALHNKRHPYREALDDAFEGCVTVMNLGAALGLERATLESDTVIIVSTLAAMRVESTDARKIYEANDRLMPTFTGLTAQQIANLGKATDFDGMAPSLANLLRIRRPVVIVDEAHNARTHLSFDALSRFDPSCILEFTATPDQDPGGSPSNVLTHVSAAELKAEEMIKLPIRLKTRTHWREAIQEALAKQADLEGLAKQEESVTGEYLRPIILFQAQRNIKGQKNVTYNVLKKSLIEDFAIPEEQIAIATGDINDLGDAPILDRDQPTRFIITVDKLREGWDCPFAYILCSVSNLTSRTAVEQILGRVLRLPHACRKAHEDLNHAYAFVTSQGFVDAANALTDALVESGFERFEATTIITPDPTLPLGAGPLFEQRVSEVVSSKPAMESLPQELRDKVSFESDGKTLEIVYAGPPMVDKEMAAIKQVFSKEEDRQAIDRLCRKSRGEDTWPAAQGRKLSVPALAVRVGDDLELFEDQFLQAAWNLNECDVLLTHTEFTIGSPSRHAADVDVTKDGKIVYHFVEDLERQLSLLDVRGPKTDVELAVWLDRAIEHPDITQTQASLFLRHMIQRLMEERGFSLEQLVTWRFRLRDAAKEKIARYRILASRQAYQNMLLPEAEMPVEVDPEICFIFPLNQYPAVTLYDGRIRFNKHYYQRPANMNDEEAECAFIIDSTPQVEYWVRNLERDGYSFWLPTPTDKFYPDFLAMLRDGRYLVVEYKGQHLLDTPDTREKKTIGELWQARSKGLCLFRLVTKTNMESELRAAVG